MATSYSNLQGSGDRRTSIYITYSSGLLSVSGGSTGYLVDGDTTTTGIWYINGGSLTSSAWIQFEFFVPIIIDEAKFYQQNSASQGNWKWQGSNDNGTTWTDIGSSFALGGATTTTITALNGNTTAYRTYRIVGVSGSTSSSPWCYEWEFKCNDVTDQRTDLTAVPAGAHYMRISVPNFGASGANDAFADVISFKVGGAEQVTNGTFEVDASGWSSITADTPHRGAYSTYSYSPPGPCGSYMLDAMNSGKTTAAYQLIDISGLTLTQQIDMNGYLGGVGSANAGASLAFCFEDASHVALAGVVLRPSLPASRSGAAGITLRTFSILSASGPQTITMGAKIATGETWSSPTVAGPITLGAKIATGETWPTPGLAAPNTINVPMIPPSLAWFTPTVAGPITVSPIASGETWPTPFLNVQQQLSLAGAISSAESWPAPRVAFVTTLGMAAPIPSGEAWPAPSVAAGPQFIAVQPILSAEAWPPPSLTGGVPGLFLFISGVDRTQYLRYEAAQIQQQTIGRWQFNFDLYDDTNTFAPVLGQTVILIDAYLRLFAGCINQVITDRFMSTDHAITYHCVAVDKSGICDHRVIAGKSYPATLNGAAQTVAGVILDIVANFLNGEGITTRNVPLDGSLGVLTADLNFNFPTVTAAFDQIAQLTGTVWWIDAGGDLHFNSLSQLPAAPFSLTETSGNWRNLRVTTTTVAYYNKLYAVSNLNIVPGAQAGGSGNSKGYVENFIFASGEPGVYNNQFTDAAGIRTSVAIGYVISMTVNGHAQTVYDFVNNFKGQTRSGANDYLWVFAAGNNQISWTYQPPGGATIVLEYVPYVATSSSLAQYGSALNPLNPEGQPLGTCGSGLYEGVIQVQNTNSQDDLNAIAKAELDRIGGIPLVVDFETDVPGLAAGQLLPVDIPKVGAAARSLLITKVEGTYVSSNLNSGPAGGGFRWTIEATSNLDPGNWVKWYERLVSRTNNPLPVLQYEEATFVLAPGASLSSGVSITNPYLVGRTGLLTELLLAAGQPPTDQTLMIQLLRNGVIIATLAMPASTTANELITLEVPKANQIYLYAKDVLNVNSFYSPSGSNPLPASNVTMKARWAM